MLTNAAASIVWCMAAYTSGEAVGSTADWPVIRRSLVLFPDSPLCKRPNPKLRQMSSWHLRWQRLPSVYECM